MIIIKIAEVMAHIGILSNDNLAVTCPSTLNKTSTSTNEYIRKYSLRSHFRGTTYLPIKYLRLPPLDDLIILGSARLDDCFV